MTAGERIARTTAKAATTKAATAKTPAPFRKPSGRASYPRRVTLDLDDARYDFLRQAAWEHRTSIAELLRSAIQLMTEDPESMTRIVAGTGTGEAPFGRPGRPGR